MKVIATPAARTSQWIGALLRLGVLTSACVVLLGAAFYLEKHGREPLADYRTFHPDAQPSFSLSDVLSRSRTFDGLAIVQIGLLLLIALPVARVSFSVVAFALEKDTLYVCITLVVLAILLGGLSGLPLH